MLSIPQIPSGVARLTWTEDADGSPAYHIAHTASDGANPPIRGNTGMLVVALMADGRRNLGDIYDDLSEIGLDVGDPARVVLLFRQLEQAGVVRMRWHYETLGPIRHACTGCGQSCQGHLVGPLSAAEQERLEGMKRTLDAEGADVANAAPILPLVDDESGEEGVYLNASDGRCVFLQADHRCAIHARFGGEMKPLQCRLFPMRVVETEDGFRVGITPRCATAQQTFESEPPITPSEWVEEMGFRRPPGDLVGLEPGRPRSLAYTRVFETQLEQETYFLAAIEQTARFGTLVARSGGNGTATGDPPAAFLAEVWRRLRAFEAGYEPSPINVAGTRYGDGHRVFRSALAALPAPTDSWREPSDGDARYLRQALRQFVFLRQTAAFPSVEVGYITMLAGVIGALWCTQVAGDDGLGRRVAHWARVINVASADRFLFDGPADFEACIAPLRPGAAQ